MMFDDLHELVRVEVERRIGRGDLTGTALARQAGFQQGHISNFVNGKRALSLGGLDRVLGALRMTVEEILPLEISGAAEDARRRTPTHDGGAVMDGARGFGATGFAGAERMTAVPVVSASSAMGQAEVAAGDAIEMLAVEAGRLHDCRARVSAKQAGWERFAAVRVDGLQAAAMTPLLAAGATVVIDRHYNSVAQYRAQQRTLFAVRTDAGLALRHVDYDEDRLILRPLAAEYPVQLIAVGEGETPGDYVVGRVCVVVSEV
jgi:plasmid maintenance system antidote protein VapI